MKSVLGVVGLLILAPRIAVAQQAGGRIQWRGLEDYDKSMDEAKRYGRPILLYFWANWSGPCKLHDAGVFSSDKVVEASERFVRILIDMSKGDNRVSRKYKVDAVPSFFYLDPDGRRIEDRRGLMPPENPDTVASLFKMIYEKYGRFPQWAESEAAALEKGKSEKKPVLLFWTDGRDAAEEFERSFGASALKDALSRFVWVRLKYTKKGNPLAAKYGVTSAPYLLVVDSSASDPAAKSLLRVSGPRDPETLSKDLAALLK